jgi:hypothetical protein
VSTANGQTFVRQLIGRSNNVSNPEHLNHFVNVRCCLPLFSHFTRRHISNPTLFPRRICSLPCLDVVELVDISRSARVNVASVTDIAFVFLENDINNQLYSIQGMSNAFVIRYKYLTTRKALKPLCYTTFDCFPDMHPLHRQFWSECFARTVFSSLDHLRQEIWRFLFRYGESQGLFPQQLVNLYFPPSFNYNLCYFFEKLNIPFQV